MTYTYKLINDTLTGNPIDFILRNEDKAQIPKDESNSDYQTYLAWVAEGNTPAPAD